MSAKVEQWLQESAHPPQHINLGLERLHKVRAQMQIRLQMPVVSVAGTNGKGSVCHLLAAMLQAAGFRVGCYTSPHLLHFGERIAVNAAPAAEADTLAALQAVAQAAAACRTDLTYFELTTLAATLLFAQQNCEIVVLEVGLGGRLDAVNVFDAEVAVITNIAMDHMEYLGDTRDAIACEKAGICRRDKPVVVGDAQPPAALLPALQQRGAQVFAYGRDFSCNGGQHWHYRGVRRHLANLPSPALPGAHQRHNAATALAALECLPPAYWPGAGAVRRGLHAVTLPARAQVLAGTPTVVLDVAHNPAAAAVLEQQLFDMGYYPRTVAVFGMLARKDIAAFVAALARRVDHWHVACPQDGDLSAAEIAAACTQAGVAVTAHASLCAAAAAARADAGDNGRMVVTGSFLTVADYLHNNAYGKDREHIAAGRGGSGAGAAEG